MLRWIALALALTAGCNGGGGGGIAPPPPGLPANPAPAALAGDLAAVSYSGGVLRIDMGGIGGAAGFATFAEQIGLKILNEAGNTDYLAFTHQEAPDAPAFLAFVAANDRGSLIALAAADRGLADSHLAGGSYWSLTDLTAPAAGSFDYAGTYVGIVVPGSRATIATGYPEVGDELEPWLTEGRILLTGDFGSPRVVSGRIQDRVLRDLSGRVIDAIIVDDLDPMTPDDPIGTATLADLSLNSAMIDVTGEFLGQVAFAAAPGTGIGTYGGLFGGTGASDLAGVLWLTPIEGQPGIFEYGAFNLPRCDLQTGVVGSDISPLCIVP